MNVAITIVVKENESLWKNGIIQNCLYAYDAFSNIPSVDKITLLQLAPPERVDLETIDFLKDYNIMCWYDGSQDFIRNEFDVIVTLGGIPAAKHVLDYKTNPNNRLVAYKGGNEIKLREKIYKRG